MNHIALQTGPITLYAQLASILRDRIVTGQWKVGDEIPTLEQLVEEFSVARVTVRQAVQILAEEGLLSSQRGRRTCVTYDPPVQDVNPLFSSTGSIDSQSSNYAIHIFARQEFDELPQQFAHLGVPMGRYMRIRKIDSQNGVPYSLSDNYVAQAVYRRIPPQAELKMKLSRLVRDHASPALTAGIERIMVGSASYEDALHLQVPTGSPVAQVTRAFLAPGNKLAYIGTLTYRGDRFAIERDITDALVQAPTEPSPRASIRAAGGRAPDDRLALRGAEEARLHSRPTRSPRVSIVVANSSRTS